MMNDPLWQMLQKLDELKKDLTSRVHQLGESLNDQISSATDPNDWVSVSVTGLGKIVELQIKPTMSLYPHRVGDAVTAAISKAREAAGELQAQESAHHLPEVAMLEGAPSDSNESLPRLHFDALSFSDAPDGRRVLAEAVDSFNRFQDIQERRKAAVVRQKIGRGMGFVEVASQGQRLRITVTRNAIGDLGPDRLAQQILEAIEQAESEASQQGQRELRSLPIGDGTLGELLDKATEQFDR